MDLELYTRFLVALLAVLLLIAAAAWLAKRFGLGIKTVPLRGRERRLSIVEVLAVDNRRRLLLLKRDGREHLVLLGPNKDLVIEGGIEAPLPENETPRAPAKAAEPPSQ